MSLVVLGLAGELRAQGHRGQRAVAAHHDRDRGDQEPARRRRADAQCPARRRSWPTPPTAIFNKPARDFTGNFLIDDTFLAGEGVTDFDQYRVDPAQPLQEDFFVPDDMPPPAAGEAWA